MNPVIGIDVAKGKSVATACLSLNEVFNKFSFEHTVSGLKRLQTVLDQVEQAALCRPQIVLEATGSYSMPLYRYFKEQHYIYHVVNPYVSSRFNRWNLRKVKTDKIDSKALCKLFYLERLYEKERRPYEYDECKALSRACGSAVRTMVKQKVQFGVAVDRCFPGAQKLFSQKCTNDLLTLLQIFPHPDTVTKLRACSVTVKIKAAFAHHHKAWCQEKALALRELAQNCYPAVSLDSIQVHLLVETAQQLQEQVKKVETMKRELVERMRSSPQFAAIASIPGFGENLAAAFLAETGDLRDFATHRQLIAFCGTEPSVYQSGSFTGTRQHLTKHGNSFLRAQLYMTVVGMANYKTNPVIRAYYEKKRLCEGKPYKVAVFACVNKLLRIIFAISTREEQFSA